MARFFEGRALWAELQRVAHSSRRLDAAVAFVGASPKSVLRWPTQSRLVSDVTAASVAAGRTSARGAKTLIDAGVDVRSFADLHAKVYVFDRRVAFVGSHNASEHSMGLQEAAVKLTAPREVAAALSFVDRLWRDASPLPRELLGQLIKLEPKRTGRRGRGRPPVHANRTTNTKNAVVELTAGRRIWFDAVTRAEPSKAVAAAEHRVAVDLSKEREVDDASEVEWTGLGRGTYRRVPEQDYVVVWWEPSTRAPYGAIEGPFRCLGGFDLGRGVGPDRYRRAEHPVRRRRVTLRSADILALSGLLVGGRVSGSQSHAASLHSRLCDRKSLELKETMRKSVLGILARRRRR